MEPETIAKSGTEHAHQCAIFACLANLSKKFSILGTKIIFAIQNEAESDNGHRGIMRSAAGRKKGVADIFVSYPSWGYHGLYIELKVGRNRQSADQKIFENEVVKNGYAYAVVYGWKQAVSTILHYLQIKVSK